MADEPQLPPEGGLIQIPNISLEGFERLVYSRDYEKAGAALVDALRRMKMGSNFIGYPRTEEVQKILFTRFSSAVLALLLDPGFQLSIEGFGSIAGEHATLDLAFRLSVYQGADHALAAIADNPDERDRMKMSFSDGNALVKYLLTYSLRSAFQLNFDDTFSRNAQLMLPLWAGMLTPQVTVALTAHARREALLGMHGTFAKCSLPEWAMPAMADAYMYCSYGTRRDKHAMKAVVHSMFADYLRAKKAPIPTAKDLAARRKRVFTPDNKPTILVGVEWWTSLHAMFRCYVPFIRQLKTRFRVVGCGRRIDSDQLAREEFDEWIEIPPSGMDFSALIARINELSPDAIYYPSMGMSLWWLALSSVRLAPVQLMTLGHPASSHSPAMDYVLCDEGAIGDPALFTETVIEYPNGTGRFVMRPDCPDLKPLIEAKNTAIAAGADVLHVAVPSMLCKLNAPFMAALKLIAERAGRPVMFHFWINMMGVSLMQAASEIQAWLGSNVRVYERRDYVDYMRMLSTCDLHLSTFPFGGTNSNIDSMLLGVPVVTLWGDEPHERFDGMMLQRAGMPELVTYSQDSYVEKAAEILRDNGLRINLRERLLATDLHSIFYVDPADTSTPFADAVWGAMLDGPTR